MSDIQVLLLCVPLSLVGFGLGFFFGVNKGIGIGIWHGREEATVRVLEVISMATDISVKDLMKRVNVMAETKRKEEAC